MGMQWALLVAGLLVAIVLGSVTTDMRSARGGERSGDRGAVDARLGGEPSGGAAARLPAASDDAPSASSVRRSDAALVRNALSAAPPAVARDAAVVALDAGRAPRLLRGGSGAFTCLPDDPRTGEPDPMCLDRAALAWALARRAGAPRSIGVGYMPGSSIDAPPVAAAGGGALRPHLMIVNAPALLDRPAPPPGPSLPYVMWAGTPHAHLMVPLDETLRLARTP